MWKYISFATCLFFLTRIKSKMQEIYKFTKLDISRIYLFVVKY